MTHPPTPGTNDDDPLGGMDPMAWLESLARRQGANPDELTTAADLDIPQPGSTPPAPSQPTPAATDDPFGGMDPMAWLESLARRQGANPDELTTAANLDIPAPPTDTKVEGPGYTPGYESAKPAPKATAPTTPPPPPAKPAPKAEPKAPEPAADDPLGGMDPMAWLESLARRQGANPDELTTAADLDLPPVSESPAAPSEILDGNDPMAWLNGLSDTQIEDLTESQGLKLDDLQGTPAEPAEPAAAGDTDFLNGMDPMAWLESLAANQGASPDELMTRPQAAVPAQPPAEPAPTPAAAVELPPAEPAAAAGDTDFLNGMDPMAWLESLAANQGANPDELMTRPQATVPAQPPAEPVPTPAAAVELPPAEPAAAGDTDFLNGMDPMAWLESLAANQGANPDELMTRPQAAVPAQPPAEPPPTPVAAVELPPVSPAAAAGDTDFLNGMDPMAWLESLAANQGANLDELMTRPQAAVPAQPPAEPAPTPVAAVELPPAEPAAAGDTDFLNGMDPMAWLESLAANQGANPDELMTRPQAAVPAQPPAEPAPTPAAAVELPPAEPAAAAGDTDFLNGMDPMAWLESLAANQGANPDELMTRPQAAMPAQPPAEPAAAVELPPAEPAAAAGDTDFLNGMDPMAWLESLAANQGANPDELMTRPQAATPAEPTVVSTEPAEEAAPAMSMAEAAALFGIDASPDELAAQDPLKWLDNFTAGGSIPTGEAVPTTGFDLPGQAMTPDAALAWLESLNTEPAELVQAPAEPEGQVTDSLMAGGMSNDPAEVQKWLEKQLESLEENRQAMEMQDTTAPVEAGEAVQSDLPDWLLESMPTNLDMPPAEPQVSAGVLAQDISLPDVSGDLPPWLAENQDAATHDFSVDDFIESMGQPDAAVAEVVPISPEELAALTQPSTPDEVDPWAEALDEEYERKRAGDESIPDWYLEALNRAGESASAEVAVPPAEPISAALPVGPIETATMPDWLNEITTEVSAEAAAEAVPPSQAEVLPGNIPDWLSAMSTETPAAAPAPVSPTLPPPWFEAATSSVPPQAVTPAVVEPKPVRAPEPARLAAPARPAVPPELTTLLSKAREVASQGQITNALEHYQTLIDNSHALEETRGDLRVLAENHPQEPKVHRLLGDAHMRLGDLQSALDTYLNALNQL